MGKTRHTVNTARADTHQIKDTGNHHPISIIKAILPSTLLSRATTKDNPSLTVNNNHMDRSNLVTDSNHLMANNHLMPNNPMTNIHQASSSRGSSNHMTHVTGLDQKVRLVMQNRASVASEAL
jgi:hypothetical protein